jgi:ABC-type transport system involved in cytochrome bd biosynthesis fused ATPase/permease subunit
MPSEGRVTIDGIPLREVHPQALARNVMWIEPSGPVWDGTIQENLRGSDDSINSGDLVDALEEVDVYEHLNRLPDGLNTIITAGDSMLGVESTYALATARALLHKPPILLAMEPPPPAEHLAEDPCLKAFRKLANSGTLVVMLPRRLQTLRSADRVVLLNGPRLVGEGKHADLLASSDLYRHLNYLLFNPYRHQKGEAAVSS